MNDTMLIEYLRKKGLGHHVDTKLKEIIMELFLINPDNLEVELLNEKYTHFDETTAKELVASMYHCYEGKKYVGEKFCMSKAQEVYTKYKAFIPTSTTLSDIYVAINAQYHDYAHLFKSWGISEVECKIIEAAMVFWFNDQDYDGDSKIYEYFKK